MNSNEIKQILSEIVSSWFCVDDTDWYLFGSALHKSKVPSDIDLLIIYRDEADAYRIRNGIFTLKAKYPLHLLFMTPTEEEEIDFINSESCVQFFPKTLLITSSDE